MKFATKHIKPVLRATVIILLLAATLPVQAQKLYVPGDMKAEVYPGHVELRWNNRTGFVYDIYRQKAANELFHRIGESNQHFYFDFFGMPLTQKQTITYRIVPKGMQVTDNAAAKFELKTDVLPATDEALIDMTQRYTTRYFSDFSEPKTGMARERSNDNNGDIVTTGGTGFGIMALIAGAERGYHSRLKAQTTISKMVDFLENTERFHGAWAHWYDARTGKVFSFSKFDDGGDLVETAFLVQGLLTARTYFNDGNDAEKHLASRITRLWESVEWNWYTQGTDSLYWHWSKNHHWKMNHRIRGYDETLITYILAASSPTFPISRKVYESSYKTSAYYINGNTYYGYRLALGMSLGGPLFFSHYSFLGLDPRGLKDEHTNYFERNRSHTLIHRAYAIDNPKEHPGLSALLWGFTSSDDPMVGYTSHHPGTNDENGTVSPTAALSSIVYTPEESMQVLRYLYYAQGKKMFGRYGFYDAYNPGMPEGQQVVKSYLAIDQGPIAVMMENYRSGLLWKLFMQNSEITSGLQKLGFEYQKN